MNYIYKDGKFLIDEKEKETLNKKREITEKELYKYLTKLNIYGADDLHLSKYKYLTIIKEILVMINSLLAMGGSILAILTPLLNQSTNKNDKVSPFLLGVISIVLSLYGFYFQDNIQKQIQHGIVRNIERKMKKDGIDLKEYYLNNNKKLAKKNI